MIEFIIILIIGYILGRLPQPEQTFKENVDKMWINGKKVIKDRPKPGVVNHLSDEEIEEKHDKIKQGNKEAFDRFFAENPPPKI